LLLPAGELRWICDTPSVVARYGVLAAERAGPVTAIHRRHGIFKVTALVKRCGYDRLLDDCRGNVDAIALGLGEEEIMSMCVMQTRTARPIWNFTIQVFGYKAERFKRSGQMDHARSLSEEVRRLKAAHEGDFALQERVVLQLAVH